jgi:lipoate-protein ligase A
VSAPLFDPCVNLAREDWLLHFTEQTGQPVLYLWQNGPVVVIGRNQCADTQCDLAFARANGIPVVRRKTGGGAVYHDAGNLNFSVLLPRALHDVSRSTGVVVASLRALGIPAEENGRNDICVHGLKVSGSAFRVCEKAGLHHGTILLRADRETMARVLRVPPLKTAAHGVDSVRARVGNLYTVAPHIRLSDVTDALKAQFCRTYGLSALQPLPTDEEAVSARAAQYRDDTWNLQLVRGFTEAKTARFTWGTATLSLRLNGTTAVGLRIDTDAADPDAVGGIRAALERCLPCQGTDGLQLLRQTLHSLQGQDPQMLCDLEALLTALWPTSDAPADSRSERS